MTNELKTNEAKNAEAINSVEKINDILNSIELKEEDSDVFDVNLYQYCKEHNLNVAEYVCKKIDSGEYLTKVAFVEDVIKLERLLVSSKDAINMIVKKRNDLIKEMAMKHYNYTPVCDEDYLKFRFNEKLFIQK
jgi:Mg2+ and Co2+ transporter CorA